MPYVLVVEDDDTLRELYRLSLTNAGFMVTAVRDGFDALRVLDTILPAAVVLDLALPRLSGRDVGQELKANARTRHIPIVVVTGTNGADADGLDIDCILRKPVLPERLVDVVNRCIQKELGADASGLSRPPH